MKIGELKYQEIFDDELNDLDNQAKEVDNLYNETHKALEVNIDRMSGKSMFGTTSPYRDISELSKSLTSIKQTRVSISHEKINLKKTIVELGLKDKQSNTDATNANTNEVLMRDILAQIGRKQEINKPFPGESNNNGIDKLQERMDPKKLGLNANDERMIERFKENIKEKGKI